MLSNLAMLPGCAKALEGDQVYQADGHHTDVVPPLAHLQHAYEDRNPGNAYASKGDLSMSKIPATKGIESGRVRTKAPAWALATGTGGHRHYRQCRQHAGPAVAVPWLAEIAAL